MSTYVCICFVCSFVRIAQVNNGRKIPFPPGNANFLSEGGDGDGGVPARGSREVVTVEDPYFGLYER